MPTTVYLRPYRHDQPTWGLVSLNELLSEQALRATGLSGAAAVPASWVKVEGSVPHLPNSAPRMVQLLAQLPGVALEGRRMGIVSDLVEWTAVPGPAVPSENNLRTEELPQPGDGFPYHGQKMVVWALQGGKVRPLGFHPTSQTFDDSDLPGLAVQGWAPMAPQLAPRRRIAGP